MTITEPVQRRSGTTAAASPRIVNSYTEWDPLEEVVVGRAANGVYPTWQEAMVDVIPPSARRIREVRWPSVPSASGRCRRRGARAVRRRLAR